MTKERILRSHAFSTFDQLTSIKAGAKMPVTPEQLEDAIRTKIEGGVEHVVS